MRNPAVKSRAGRRSKKRPPRQRDIVRDVMLSANECETWLTLDELARITRFPPASISAQLRHLRRPQHGGFRLRKRCRSLVEPAISSVDERFARGGPLWEYRIGRARKEGQRRAARSESWA